MKRLLAALVAMRDGNFRKRLTVSGDGEMAEIAAVFNEVAERNMHLTGELTRVRRMVGREGKLTERLEKGASEGSWAVAIDASNALVDDLVRPVSEVGRVLSAVAEGDLEQRMELRAESDEGAGHPLRGEFLKVGRTVNNLVDQLSTFTDEVTRVASEVGTEGKLGGQARVRGMSGSWKDLTDSVNTMAYRLTAQVRDIALVTTAVAKGDLSRKVTVHVAGEMLELKNTVNTMVDQLSSFSSEVTRVAREVGTEGELGGQAQVSEVAGVWKDLTDSVNLMAGNLTAQVRGIAQVTTAVANGDLSQKVTVSARGEVAQLAETINQMTETLRTFADEVTRVANEVGAEGRLGGQANVPGAAGTWKDLTDSVNTVFRNLTTQVRDIAQVTTAVASGDLSQKIDVDARGEILELKNTINTMVDQLSAFADQVTRVAREVGTEGRLGGQAQVPGVAGVWRDLTDSVNGMAGNLTAQVRNIAQVATAVARGDLSQKIDVDARGEILELKNTLNTMVDQLSNFAEQVTRVAREVGTEGQLGGQAEVQGVSGTWKDLTQSVNFMANNLTIQVRNIAEVTTAVARGDLSKKITVDAKGEILELVTTVNTMVDQLSNFAEQVTRVAREVGTEGNLGGQARVPGVTGIWKDLSDNVNLMANNLTGQVRNISQVATAVANGDLTKKVTVEASGEVAQLADTVNTMVKTLSSFADQVTRVAREVGTDGILGGQARVPGVSGTWKDLTESVNGMAANLTGQVRNIAMVTTAIAKGDLTKKIDIDARGEILELKTTINTMVDQLSSFAEEVTRVAREVGTEGQLGGLARVRDIDGTWRDLTESVNEMAGNLTRQVRAIAAVATAVTRGDLNLKIDVDAAGEIQVLQDNINTMIANLRDTTLANKEQDWLKGNLARISGLMQGRRDLDDVASLIMSELTPVVSAQHGAFFVAMPTDDDPGAVQENAYELRMLGSYGYSMGSMPTSFRPGETLIGTAALERRTILVENVPPGYLKIASGLGEAPPAHVIVLPVLFEGTVLGVIELASFQPFTQIQKDFLSQIAEMIATSVNTISVNTKTEVLLKQSQELTEQLQERSAELENRQKALQDSNAELEEKAELLAQQNRDIEVKNTEIEEARQVLEERAEQLAVSMRYKSEFLANMSHELRTPLNSLLILAKLLADNADSNLTPKQVEFAETIHGAGSDLLQLINDILDLSKVEAGKMDVSPTRIALVQLVDYVEATFRPLTAEKGLDFSVRVSPELPATLHTDEQRLLQVLRNLLSNAVKFTDSGAVELVIRTASADVPVAIREQLLEAGSLVDADADLIAFSVTDTGIGIAASKMRVIFEAFKQADGTTSRKYGGTGLGLSISREIARLLGGEIHAASEAGRGSTFTLYLPLHQSELPPQGYPQPSPGAEGPEHGGSPEERPEVSTPAEVKSYQETQNGPAALFRKRRRAALTESEQPLALPPAPPVQEEAPPGPPPEQQDAAEAPKPRAGGARGMHFASEKVLIVDDDIRNVFALTSVLEQHGLTVLYAENGREGIEVLEQHDDITVVLMDIMMPEMDGYATTTAIRRMPQFAGLPIVALTAKAMKGDREKAIESGASDYVTKPVDPDHLLSVMERWMHER
ncbi:two-component system sensor kinase [Streptomyces albus]|uniref:Circadian input-output histidine kinase CikA n=1 Tax=Streptomyces albus (strain ATCC 21838 / DSM 41398 / FERM P-419 / JCM 4703 / NBRC 107858) TaxID=1081613 RepID=A0A0B5EI85_STRA4|nr:two-component system sensor kinase [Streptomyces albus]